MRAQAQQAPRPEDRVAMPWWKSRKWLLHLTYRMFAHYSNPSTVRRTNAQKFATVWAVSASAGASGRHASVSKQIFLSS